MHRRILLGAAALAAPGLLAARGPRAQPAPAAAPGRAALHRVAVGGLEAFIVSDGTGTWRDATAGLVANADAAQVTAALRAAGLPGPELPLPYNITVVRGPSGLVMLDTGTGGTAGPGTGAAAANLRAAGIDPAQVAVIAISHFHGDHVGGLTTAEGVANFPNARLLVPAREWAFWNDEGEESRATAFRRPAFANARRRLAPYRDRMETFAPGAAIAPGITVVDSAGHSPGHVCFLVADGGAQLMVLGDAILMPPLFVANPDWVPVFDMDPEAARAARRALLARLAADRVPVAGYHFDMPATGRFEAVGSGYRLVPEGA